MISATRSQTASGRAETIVSTAIQECFQQAKGEAGLDHYQVRSWRAWYAHITLSMLALAWLAASKAQTVKGEPAPATRA